MVRHATPESTARIVKINDLAKEIRKEHPNMDWNTVRKRAGKQYTDMNPNPGRKAAHTRPHRPVTTHKGAAKRKTHAARPAAKKPKRRLVRRKNAVKVSKAVKKAAHEAAHEVAREVAQEVVNEVVKT